MSENDEARRIDEKVVVIRAYLGKKFLNFQITEDEADPSTCWRFTVTQLRPAYESFKLQVGWPRLADRKNTPKSIERSLIAEDVAAEMRKVKGEYFIWG